MRLSTDPGFDPEAATAVIAEAAGSGITVFDTAHSYGIDARDAGRNEELLARALRAAAAQGRARVVTKGGMARSADGWIPDGRARSILAGCEASLGALGGLKIDMYLVHA